MTESKLNLFLNALSDKQRSENTIISAKGALIKTQEFIKKPLEDATYEELMGYIKYVRENGSPTTDERTNKRKDRGLGKNSIHTIESKYIQFYFWLFNQTDESKYNKLVRQLKDIRVNKPKNSVTSQDVISIEEIKRLLNIATLERDRCILASFWESGMRLGEFLSLDNKMVNMDEAKQEVTFFIPNTDDKDDKDDDARSKTGARTVVCVDIYSFVQDWFRCHPDPSPNKKFMPFSKNCIRKVIKKWYIKAGIKKPYNVHMLRHSAITYWVELGLNPIEISYRAWGIPNSNMLATYIHESEKRKANAYKKSKGKETDENKSNNLRIDISIACIRCGHLMISGSGSVCKSCQDVENINRENDELKNTMDKYAIQNEMLQNEMKSMQKFMAELIVAMPSDVVKKLQKIEIQTDIHPQKPYVIADKNEQGRLNREYIQIRKEEYKKKQGVK
ncbi:MAG: tyrosine-type recombinase/integrase [Candidatus Methanoperedens sp.]|nr:tyrosine-type recombinase/integrase [Candidatus Methanoperedens sp.]CAG0948565.1 Tyrosine recombinase XerC [Methanosarcinales archaeon]